MPRASRYDKWLSLEKASEIAGISSRAVTRWITKMNLIPEDCIRIEKKGRLTVRYLKHPDWAVEVTKKLDLSSPATKLYSPTAGKFLDQKLFLQVEGSFPNTINEKVQASVQATTKRDQLEQEKLELANHRAKIELATALGELVKLSDIEAQFRNGMTDIAKLLDDLPFKIADNCSNLDHDNVLDKAEMLVDELKDKIINAF